MTIRHYEIDANTSGEHELVPASEGQPIVVLAYALVVAGEVAVSFAVDGGALTGEMPFAPNGGIACPYNPAGWFATPPGEALLLDLSDDVAVGGHLVVQIGGPLRV